MDEKTAEGLERLLDQILDVSDKLARVEEQQFWKPTDVASCHAALDGIVDRYKKLLEAVPADEHEEVERSYGRKVTELRRSNDWLPERSRGSAVPLATDDQWSRAGELKAGPSIESQQAVLRPARVAPRPTGPHVGGEIEAWCGPCKGLRDHTVVAMVGDEPKQVLCESCGARHNFRSDPPRAKKKPVVVNKRKLAKQSHKELEQQRKDAERAAFLRELDEATDIKELSRRTRYRHGQIIEHPEHGRGKIEHVVKGSLLVRFRGGLKPINL